MALKLQGKVMEGQKAGRRLGYPTANIDGRATRGAAKHIRAGIYAGLVRRKKNGKIYKAAVVVRRRQGRRHLQIEAYLINFAGNLYGERLQLEFKKFIRPWRIFANSQKMIAQIKKDIKKILKHLP